MQYLVAIVFLYIVSGIIHASAFYLFDDDIYKHNINLNPYYSEQFTKTMVFFFIVFIWPKMQFDAWKWVVCNPKEFFKEFKQLFSKDPKKEKL